MPDEITKPESTTTKSSGYTRRDARRDALLGLLILVAIVSAYFTARHRRVSHLNAFAQCLSSKQAKMYGAYWCPHCADQEELFGSSFQYVNYVECGIPGSHAFSDDCKQAGIKRIPTWQFSTGERHEGMLQLNVLGEKTGCALP